MVGTRNLEPGYRRSSLCRCVCWQTDDMTLVQQMPIACLAVYLPLACLPFYLVAFRLPARLITYLAWAADTFSSSEVIRASPWRQMMYEFLMLMLWFAISSSMRDFSRSDMMTICAAIPEARKRCEVNGSGDTPRLHDYCRLWYLSTLPIRLAQTMMFHVPWSECCL